MKTTLYLYDIEPTEFANMPYKQALEYKIKCAKQLILTLYDEPFGSREDKRIDDIFEAIEFNEQLLKEIE